MHKKQDLSFEDLLKWVSIRLVHEVLSRPNETFDIEKLKKAYFEGKLNIEESDDYTMFAAWVRKEVDGHLKWGGYFLSIDPIDHEDVIHGMIDFAIRGIVYTPTLGEDRGNDVMVVYPISKLKWVSEYFHGGNYRLVVVPFAWNFRIEGSEVTGASKSIVVTYRIKGGPLPGLDNLSVDVKVSGDIDAC